MCRFLGLGLATILMAAVPAAVQAAGKPTITLSPTLERERPALEAAIQRAFDRLTAFSRRHGFAGHPAPAFLQAIQVYDAKPDFDQALTTASGSADMQVPMSFVGTVAARTLFVVSPRVYREVHPGDEDPAAWEKLLTHEMAHQLHVDILGGHEDRMGPVWFYEGFACVVADQYRSELPTLTREERQHILFEKRRSASYRRYEALLRHYMTGAPLAELVKQAGQADFDSWLTRTFQDVPVPAPTPANVFHRSM